jgi:diketogulonate reductase-like aldo/keto reductase
LNRRLQRIGKAHNKSPSQVALRWLVQQDIAVIPKASTIKHLKDNLDIFDFTLSPEEMLQIEKLDQKKRFCSPEGMPIFED